jgi:hypothetical protein
MNINELFSTTHRVVGIVLAFFITLFSVFSVSYGIRYILTPVSKQNMYSWVYIIVTIISGLWSILFGYVFIKTIMGSSPLSPDEFGAILIRPVILVTVAAMAICQRIRYIDAKNGEVTICQQRKTY